MDRCAGTGALEAALVGLYDKNGDELISHAVVSTYEYYEYKVLNERLGDKVRDIIPPTEADVVYSNGTVANADAMSEEYINNPLIKKYLDDEDCAVIMFENPPFRDAGASDKENKSKVFKNYVQQEITNENLVNKTVSYDLSNLFIWSAFKFYLRQNSDAYIVFSPIKYWKTHCLINKRFIKGYAFNREHFHATASTITCILWSNEDSYICEDLSVKAYNIEQGGVIYQKDIVLKRVNQMSNKILPSISEYSGSEGIACELSGVETNRKLRGKPLYNKNYFAYIRINGFKIDNLNRTLTTLMPYSAMGRYLTKDNYMNLLPLFVAKLMPLDNWYEKDIYATTSDGGDAYTKDSDFLKSCLIYTCLSNQNKCLSFTGSDGRYYKNELSFEEGTLARKDLEKYSLDETEEELIELWDQILDMAKSTANYDGSLIYGVYQITKDLNTFEKVKVGKSTKNVYDYPELNGNLETLKVRLKEYYKTHIWDKMFQYELVK